MFNCRVQGPTVVQATAVRIGFQNCYFTNTDIAVDLADVASHVSINNCSLESSGHSALYVRQATHVSIQGCEIATAAAGYPAIEDLGTYAMTPQHLYAHNHIRSPFNAIRGSAALCIAFLNNTVQGNLAGLGLAEYMANNVVVGTIQWVDGDPTIAGNPTNGNVIMSAPALPDPWQD